jgi:sugar transferase EpsL
MLRLERSLLGLASRRTTVTHAPRIAAYLLAKEVCDRTCALCLLVALAPLLVILAVCVRWKLGSPLLFRQTRIGHNERPFTILKFRSMSDARLPDGTLAPDAERLGSFGAWLRSGSLDELPQLWNILRGDMSFIGPRPLLPQYLPRYDAPHRRRHQVKPGLSGFAQIHGRNACSWRERLDLDVEYVDRIGLRLDLMIALATIAKLLKREGIAHPDSATMPEFSGLNSDV